MDEIDQKIFILLLENPFRSMNDMAKIIGVQHSAVSSRIDVMKERGFLPKDQQIHDPILGERTTSHCVAIINNYELGLIKHHVIFVNIRDKMSVELLEKFFDFHPYTVYRVQLLGYGISYYAQFAFPPHIADAMAGLYETLRIKLSISNFFILQGEELIDIRPNLFYWGNLENYWNIVNKKEEEKTKMIDFFWNNYLEEKENGVVKTKIMYLNPKYVNISEIQLKLLRELTINGNISISELSTYYDRDKSTISRHISSIKEKYIKNGILFFKPSEFDLNSFKIITGEIKNENLDVFKEFLSSQQFPFYGYITFNLNKFLMYLVSNHTHLHEIYSFIYPFIVSINEELKLYELDLLTSHRYYFYHLNFDEKGIFNTDKKYFYDDPLEELDKLMNTRDVL